MKRSFCERVNAQRGHSNLAWEVIIVDDNSPDGTQDIAKQLATVYGEDKIVMPFTLSRISMLKIW